ncbi:RNA methyltransferase [Moraxella oblonga]|uniref:RNA methyltransferase n=1 Tax=Moraxella oblonga TaxID=200413 RepID=UPI0008331BD8|nr:TrmJ/YjtD family RNA methyltransferase [Moraxella oblonga]
MLNKLCQIHTILVNTTLPANIGSTARALHTMGLSHLTVVNPRLPIDDTSYANSAGGACVLDHAKIVDTLDDALSPHSLILMASARCRHMPRPILTPSQSAVVIDDFLNKNPTSSVALVFGREDRGLTNDELALAHYHIQIPANPTYPVLNVASSVQVIASFIYAHFHTPANDEHGYNKHKPKYTLDITHRTDWDEPAISFDDNTKLQKAVLDLFVQLNLANDDNLANLPNRLTRLANRVQLDKKEFALLMSLIHRIKQHIPSSNPIEKAKSTPN